MASKTGKKAAKVPCPECDGSGQITPYYTMVPYPCDTCEGTGVVDEPGADDATSE